MTVTRPTGPMMTVTRAGAQLATAGTPWPASGRAGRGNRPHNQDQPARSDSLLGHNWPVAVPRGSGVVAGLAAALDPAREFLQELRVVVGAHRAGERRARRVSGQACRAADAGVHAAPGWMAPERVQRAEERRVLQVPGNHPPALVRPAHRQPGGGAESREEHDQEHPGGLREPAQLAWGGDRNVYEARHNETDRDQAKEYDGEQHGRSLAADLPSSRPNRLSPHGSSCRTVIDYGQ